MNQDIIAALAIELTDENGVPGVWLGWLTVAGTLVLGYQVLFRGPNPNNSKAKNRSIGGAFIALGIIVAIGAAVLAPGYADKARAANNVPADVPAVAAEAGQ